MERVESGLWRRRRRSRGHKGDKLRQVGEGRGQPCPRKHHPSPLLAEYTYIHTYIQCSSTGLERCCTVPSPNEAPKSFFSRPALLSVTLPFHFIGSSLPPWNGRQTESWRALPRNGFQFSPEKLWAPFIKLSAGVAIGYRRTDGGWSEEGKGRTCPTMSTVAAAARTKTIDEG